MTRNSLTATQSVMAERQRPSNLCRDRFVDKSYFKDDKDDSSQSKYLKAPWRHCKRPLDSYLSLRFAEKEVFLEKLKEISEKDWDRIQHEIRRIDNDRSKFQKNLNKKFLNSEIRDSYSDWKKAVSDPSEIRQIRQDRAKRLKKQPMSDVHKNILTHWDLMHLKQLEAANGPPTSNQPEPAEDSTTEHVTADPYHGFKAGAMYFKKLPDGTLTGINAENEKCNGTNFPNQKIALKDILDNNPKNNPFLEKHSDNQVRYFHFPSNNMEWIEKAIKQYYGAHGNEPKDWPRDCQRLLDREYWAGQMHGGGPADRASGYSTSDTRRTTPVHSRHMRSKCLLVPRETRPKISESWSTGHIPMASSPTGAQRAMSIGIPLAERNVAIFMPYLHWETSSRRAQMVKVINEATGSNSKINRKKLLWPQAVDEELKKKKSKDEAINRNKEPRVKRRQYLARYLFAVARMAEEIDYSADEKLLREKVDIHSQSPLHVRRTLDQYYFLTLDNTAERDRDQVVYRGTRSLDSTTRVVMVDQLWMWILDDNTIITAYPRRWGRNKPDPSGVHKSLRLRLEHRKEVIKSTHHLAMIIMDQCSRVFFDRTQALDQRPEVMDLFAAAIGTVTEKTRIAYDHFWRAIAVDPHYKSLVINPEGVVLKEAQDIVEELMIMKRVYCEQLKVAKEFMRHLTHPHGRHAAMSGDAVLMNKFIAQLKRTMAKDPEDDDYEAPDLEAKIDEESVHEAHDLIELLQARLAEILDLEESASRACTQIEGLLALKQQQASIVESRAALDTANESYKQGRTIQAFTIVTIVFLPLGFIAAFFGMNNIEINDAPWMSLWQQIKWMFGGTAVVIFISISLAFGSWFGDLIAWIRAVLRFAFDVPWAIFFNWTEMTNAHDWWKSSLFNSKNLERKRVSVLANIAKKRRDKTNLVTQKQEEEEGGFRLTRMPTALLPGYDTGRDADDMLSSDEKKGIIQRMTRLRWAPGKANGAADTSV